MKIVNGDIFDCDADALLHQVNCRGVMGGGVFLARFKCVIRITKDRMQLSTYLHKMDMEEINATQIIMH